MTINLALITFRLFYKNRINIHFV